MLPVIHRFETLWIIDFCTKKFTKQTEQTKPTEQIIKQTDKRLQANWATPSYVSSLVLRSVCFTLLGYLLSRCSVVAWCFH